MALKSDHDFFPKKLGLHAVSETEMQEQILTPPKII